MLCIAPVEFGPTVIALSRLRRKLQELISLFVATLSLHPPGTADWDQMSRPQLFTSEHKWIISIVFSANW